MRSGTVALLTDFGLADAYVGIMKGVILRLNPNLRIVDLSHQVDCFNILSASYLLYAAWDYLPQGTVICGVVDPGVGSNRAALMAQAGTRSLIAPDNGLLSLLARMHPELSTYCLNLDYLRTRVGMPSGSTFHGRDIFAPAAALCASGKRHRLRGAVIQPLLLEEVSAGMDGQVIEGRILHQDRFGNCITSIHRRDVDGLVGGSLTRFATGIRVGDGLHLKEIRDHYAQGQPGQPLVLFGSAGFLEIAIREGSAARALGIGPGDPVTLTFHP